MDEIVTLTGPMNRDAWQRMKTIAAEAWSRAPGERAAYVEQAAAGDENLSSEVLALVESMERVGQRFETPRLSTAAVRHAADAVGGPDRLSLAGTRVGPWEIVRELGHGGMGTVYLVERADAEFRQRGAIKMARAFADEELPRRAPARRAVPPCVQCRPLRASAAGDPPRPQGLEHPRNARRRTETARFRHREDPRPRLDA
jgi:serine/threonine-protein kinase